MISIRIAEEADVAVFYELLLEEARHHNSLQHVHTDVAELRRAGFGKDKKFGVLLAEYGAEPAGYVSYTSNYSIWLGADFVMIDDVFVTEKHRGKGIGEALMLRMKDLAKADGHTRIRWGVESDNGGAIRFYERLGATVHTKGMCTWEILPPRSRACP